MPQPLQPPDESLDLAEMIRRISDGMDRLLRSGLNKRAVVVLIKHETGLAQKAITAVLDELPKLAAKFTKATEGK